MGRPYFYIGRGNRYRLVVVGRVRSGDNFDDKTSPPSPISLREGESGSHVKSPSPDGEGLG